MESTTHRATRPQRPTLLFGEDYRVPLLTGRSFKKEQCALHACALITNRIYLPVTPHSYDNVLEENNVLLQDGGHLSP